MSAITQAMYDALSGDAALVAMLNTYDGKPAIFTTDPAPGDAVLPYIVTAGDIAREPFDTKTTRGRVVTRDVRCYSAASGSAIVVEAIAEKVYAILHRRSLTVAGFTWVLAECSGPQVTDEQDSYGRIVTVRMMIEEV